MASVQPYITLEEALRQTGPLMFNLMLKPAGSLCNLGCSYCYYLDKSSLYGGREPRMSENDLERYIKAYFEACRIPEINFIWHGGEPAVMGLEFYRKAVQLQKRYGDGRPVHNVFQTNATLIDDGWAQFFRDENFLLGVSVDGPREIHDRYRRDRGGQPTFDRVMKGISALNRHGVEFNAMATISHSGEGHGAQVYDFLKTLGTRFIQFSPVVEHVKYPLGPSGKPDRKQRPYIVSPTEEGAVLAPWSVSGIGFGTFLCDVFDRWSAGDIGQVFVNYFDATLANWCGVMPGLCSFAQVCGGNSVVEHNGDVYSCDHFVYPEHRIGNIFTDSLEAMMRSREQLGFGAAKRNSLPDKCFACKWRTLCNGGCPKHRFNRTENGQTGLSALCDGYAKFFRHSEPLMKKMKDYILLQSSQNVPSGLSGKDDKVF